MPDDRGESRVATTLYCLAAVAGLLTFLFQFNIVPWPFGSSGSSGSGPADGRTTNGQQVACRDPHTSLSKGSGPSGTSILVTGTGFPSDEKVTLHFHTEELTPARTDAAGTFRVTVVVPGTFDAFAGQQFALNATTTPSVCTDEAPFLLTR